MNKKFLNHNYITDVISFDLSESEDLIIGEIYICLPQTERQAKEYKITFKNELLRLAIHGILHILGFDDSTSKEKKEMTRLENYFLNHQ
jgi:rRNA maturation RNase YbeY